MKHSDKSRLSVRELAVFAMLGALMFAGDLAFEWAPNIHPVTMLTVIYALCYRAKAIFPIAVYIGLEAVFFGGLWLVPYCYIFPLCLLCVLLLPRNMSQKKLQVCCTLICTLFGLLFGTLYAPWQALVFMKTPDIEKILAWIVSGLPYDIIHAAGNFAASFLIFPILDLMKRLDKRV